MTIIPVMIGLVVPAMCVRTVGGADRYVPLSELTEVTFDASSVSVVATSSDFTVADDDFVSIRFVEADLSALERVEAPAESSAPSVIFDLGGRRMGSDADGLPAGVYVKVSPGQQPAKIVVSPK